MVNFSFGRFRALTTNELDLTRKLKEQLVERERQGDPRRCRPADASLRLVPAKSVWRPRPPPNTTPHSSPPLQGPDPPHTLLRRRRRRTHIEDKVGTLMDLATPPRRHNNNNDELATRRGESRPGASGVPPINRTIWDTTAARRGWDDDDDHESPPSFGSSSSQFSSSVDSDFGGAAITPRDTQPTATTADRKNLFARRMYETDTEDDDSDGGIGFDMDMDPEFTYAPSMAMDEDETFSTSSRGGVAEPGDTLGNIVPLPPPVATAEGEGRTASPMQLDSPFRPAPTSVADTPVREDMVPHEEEEEDEVLDVGSPNSEQVEVGNLDSEDVPPSRSPSPPAEEEPQDDIEGVTFDAGVGFIVDAINVAGGFLGAPSSGQTLSFLENHPHLAAFPEYFMSSPTFFPDLFSHFHHQPAVAAAPAATANNNNEAALPTAFIYEADFSEDDLEDVVAPSNDIVFDNDLVTTDMERYNSDFANFCGQLWNQQMVPLLYQQYQSNVNPPPPRISREGLRIPEWAKTRPSEITREDVEERGMDMQGIQWDKLELNKKQARRWRQSRYVNYRNIPEFTKENLPAIKSNREYYSFLRHNALHCRLMHFQLRNILAIADRNNLFFSAADQVNAFHPITHTVQDPFLDLREDKLPDHYPIRISTLGACGGQDAVLVAGGFNGTFALKPLNANFDTAPITGTITDHENGITNHIHLLQSPGRAVVCSNDNHIRIMDVSRGKFTAHHPFPWAVNCSATAPDTKLRVVVGDAKETLIVDAERGRTEFTLHGHQDFGFAAAWSEDAVTLATGNQDQTVRIYDARSLRKPLKVFPMKMAGCRTLRFSPLGNGGKRVLAMAEPADLVHFVDATNWNDAQTLTFWGEVGGIAFSPDGEECYIANCDRYVGGITTLSRKRGVGWYHMDENEEDEQEEEGEDDRVQRRWRRRGADLGAVYV